MSGQFIVWVVIAQVAVFQFLSAVFSHAVPVFIADAVALPRRVADRVRTSRLRAMQSRGLLGCFLLLGILLSAWVLPLSSVSQKLGLATVSLLSSAWFAGGVLRDRKLVRRISIELPTAPMRMAILERRDISSYYSGYWEGIPLALLVVTWIAVALTWQRRIANGSDLLAGGLLQGIWVGGSYLFVRRKAKASGPLPVNVKPILGSVARATLANESPKQLELRILLAVRVVVALMIGLHLTEFIASQHEIASDAASGAVWVLVVLLFVLFAVFHFLASALTRGVIERREARLT